MRRGGREKGRTGGRGGRAARGRGGREKGRTGCNVRLRVGRA